MVEVTEGRYAAERDAAEIGEGGGARRRRDGRLVGMLIILDAQLEF